MRNIEPIAWIRLKGETLDVNSIPIYELGKILIAFQRIINKTQLYHKQFNSNALKLNPLERKQIALQIGVHNKSSDEYGLIPFLTDPDVVTHIKTLIVDGFVALGWYGIYKFKNRNKPDNDKLVKSIYTEVKSINDRINNIGGVQTIEVRSASDLEMEPILFNSETQKSIREMKYNWIYGKKREINGIITKLFPNRLIAEIKLRPSYYVIISLNERDFENIRYNTNIGDRITFIGYPKFRMGYTSEKIRYFDAISIGEIKED